VTTTITLQDHPTVTTIPGPVPERIVVGGEQVTKVFAGGTVVVQGSGGSGQSVVAGEVLGGHRVVTAAGLYPTDLTLDAVFGITTGAAGVGVAVAIITEGPMVEPSWAWVPGDAIYAGALGVLTQVEPAGPVKRVGTAISATKISVAIQPTIYRE
jgi:hypothetical protein